MIAEVLSYFLSTLPRKSCWMTVVLWLFTACKTLCKLLFAIAIHNFYSIYNQLVCLSLLKYPQM